MMIELKDVLSIATPILAGVAMLVRLESSTKTQTSQHASLKLSLDGLAKEVRGIGKQTSKHEGQIEDLDGRVERCEARLDRGPRG